MASKSQSKRTVGVVGAGSFGMAVANLLAENNHVILYARKAEVAEQIRQTGENEGVKLHERVSATNSLQEVAEKCDIIFPVVPSANFRQLMRTFAQHLRPYHILIHGTKGLDLHLAEGEEVSTVKKIKRNQVHTMSEVILQETDVLRVGCLAGPNLARELNDRQPAATVVASDFTEVIEVGQQLLRSDRFQVYGSPDLIGVEFCGVLKNIIAIAAGALSGMGMGENARALLVSRGMVEMIHIGNAMGGNTEAFVGLAGVGDLVATSSSVHSRNYTVGYRLAQGEKLQDIISTMTEVAEGVNTIRTIRLLLAELKTRAPITETLYRVLYEELPPREAMQLLMKYPFQTDIDFL